MATIKIKGADQALTHENATSAHRAAGVTFRALCVGERLAPLPKGAGSYLRACVGGARRDAVATLDAINGRPGRGATRDDRIAWYVAALDSDAGEPTPAE